MGGFIHILLVIAIIVLGVDLFRDERYWRDLNPSRRRCGIGKGFSQQVVKNIAKPYDTFSRKGLVMNRFTKKFKKGDKNENSIFFHESN